MRKLTSSVVVAIAAAAFLAVLLAPTESHAQESKAKTAKGTPAKAQPAASKSNYKAPRTKDGKPDLNGVWMSSGMANWNLEPHGSGPAVDPKLGSIFAVPPSMGFLVGRDTIPYKPDALIKKQENFAKRAKEDPEAKCYMGGVPRANYMPYPFQIVQGAESIQMVYEYAGAVRNINMGKPVEAPANSWMGQSNGHWEGETLVVDVTSLDENSWLTRAGDPHSDQLHVVERYTMRSPDILMYEARIEDPETYTEPWTIRVPLYRQVEGDGRILEFKCVVYAEELLYGDLRKPAGAATPPPANNGKGKGKGKGKGNQ